MSKSVETIEKNEKKLKSTEPNGQGQNSSTNLVVLPSSTPTYQTHHEKHPGGRPLKFKSPEEILKKAEQYFRECRKQKRPITITGLALALDTSRETLMKYEGRPEFADAVKKVKLVCENYAETQLYGRNPTGAIFALKNYGWIDKKEIELRPKLVVLDD
jgi:hypothetical protein